MKIGGFLKQQHPVTILIDVESTNNFMDSKVVAQSMLHIENCSRIAIHHRLNTATDAGPQEHNAPTIGATREPYEELQIRTQSHGVSALRTRLI
ncbi:hypothetical protein BHE74_00013620 [Ensete ventricosum]|nr:hypothetical protein BHE74_00013620 [Ensete ventricosum]